MGQVKLFYSYSNKDEELRRELEKHLSLLRREGKINDWHFRNIEAGAEWEHEIDRNIETAKIILLLISPDFMFSEYCYCVEMDRAMARHKSGESRAIPVILRPVDWKGAPFGKLQALPRNGKAVTSWANCDEAFLDISIGIRRVCEGISKTTTKKVNRDPATKEVFVESDYLTKGHYCSRCGVKVGGAPSECLGIFGGSHDFKEYSGHVFCSRCGAKPGKKTSCIGLYNYHDFKVYKGSVYCSKCGVKAGKRTDCNNIFSVFHDFSIYTRNIYCTRCGTRPGEKTVCTGMNTAHDFRNITSSLGKGGLTYL